MQSKEKDLHIRQVLRAYLLKILETVEMPLVI